MERTDKTQTQARNKLKAALRDRARAVAGEEVTERSKLGDVAELWLRELRSSTKATRTKQTYQESWKRDLSKAVSALMVRELTVGVAERVLRTIRDEAGLGSAKHAKVVLTGIAGLAVRYGALSNNPVREIGPLGASSKPRQAPKKLTEITWDDHLRLLAYLRADVRAVRNDLVDLVDLFSAVGPRIGELLALDWTRVDFDASTVALEGTVIRVAGVGLVVQGHTKSSAGMRTLKIPQSAMDVLRKRHAEAAGTWVFPSSTGTLRDPDNTRKSLRRVLAGSEWQGLHPHAYRHLVATLLDAAGLTAREIADYLGHAQVSMTQDVYMNRKAVGGAAADALEGLRQRPETTG
ncbi:site-specific integrase [Actinosynnema sp. NPDC023658]|uniref:site-specific integrase n=1 Tax=Actinosynnema sp. NPDC023658 TaxID=3155465 RepID=UPI0033EF0AB9